jgi:membrane protease subunit (stomatin/prohibitin family)
MALIDVVKCEVTDKEFVYKFPSDDLKLGTQLVVYPAQTAFFVKGGKVLDEFQAGTYTLKTSNIPLLNKLINLPFGSNSPFKADVWFVSLIAKLDIKWGTPTPIQLEDPRYNVIVPVRAFGQYGIKITNPRLFLETMIGNMTSFTAKKIDEYFRGKILSQLSALISRKIANDHISILEINAHLVEMSEYCDDELDKPMAKYGIEIVDFSFISINVPQDDPSIIKLKESKDLAARMKIAGKDVFQMQRSFDVMEAAVKNESGGIVSLGAGIGAGFGVGGQVGAIFGQMLNTNPATPPPLPPANYFLYFNNAQQGGFDLQTVANLIAEKQITAETLVWKQGMANWAKINTLQEFNNLFGGQQMPPPLPDNL